MFIVTLQQTAQQFLFMLIGFLLARKKILPVDTPESLSKLAFYVFLPALSFRTFCNQFTVERLSDTYKLLLIATAIFIGVALVAYLSGRLLTKDLYQRDICAYSICVPNCSYFGNALVMAIAGEEMLLLYQIVMLPLSIYVNTEGVRMLTKKPGRSLRTLVSPPMLAIVLGVICGLLNVKLPAIAQDVLSGAANCLGPVAMILTGCIIAKFNLRGILGDGKEYAVVAIRMLLIPLLVFGVCVLFRMPKEYRFILMACYAMPTGLNTVLFPSMVNEDCRLGAGMACVSNALAVLTVPLMMSLVV